jgi:catechol 2,3-dioxygenase-like lactoylglutathione lyase family enzyme
MPNVLSAAPPIAFLATTDPARARAFYEGKLGLRLVAEDAFALVFDLHGTMLRITRVESFQAQPFTVLGWRVEDLDAAVRELTKLGIRFERYPALEQDAYGIWTSPSGARIAWFKDPDGNVLSLGSYQ